MIKEINNFDWKTWNDPDKWNTNNMSPLFHNCPKGKIRNPKTNRCIKIETYEKLYI